MKDRLKQWLFPEWSKWEDVYMFDSSGHYKLIQVRHRMDNNKKQFRTASIGFVNDYTVKQRIYEAVIGKGASRD